MLKTFVRSVKTLDLIDNNKKPSVYKGIWEIKKC